jgi:UTP--glucose-1-phosphate uridylyltransferase
MIRKAVIAAAGYGSRFFPATKVINKCMLPILNRPIIELAVEDCVKGGIGQIALVTRSGHVQIREHFSYNRDLDESFKKRGWSERYKSIARLHRMAEFRFLEQPVGGPYGSALAVATARDFVGNEEFLFIAADDVILRYEQGSEGADLVRHFMMSGFAGAILATTVAGRDAHKYGVLTTRRMRQNIRLLGITEKPKNFPSPQAFVYAGWAVLPPEIWDYVDVLSASSVSGEYEITDAIHALARDCAILVHETSSSYYNCGEVSGWVSANLAAARVTGLDLNVLFGNPHGHDE